MTRGLVLGSFMPPHNGHLALIEFASKRCGELTALVCSRPEDVIAGTLRYAWMKELCAPYANVRVVEVTKNLPQDKEPSRSASRIWGKYLVNRFGTFDFLFSSEQYGDYLEEYTGIRHVPFDYGRERIPISSRQIRANPFMHWKFLPPSVRAYYTVRIVALGAESTGTTTLARALAERLETAWVPEFGRMYYEGRMALPGASRWTTDEFVFIAKGQNKLEDALARRCNKVLICDTDSFTTNFWHERYMGFWSREVEVVSAGRKCDLYLLTDADIPFVQDGTRDGEKIRLVMHERFKKGLARHKKTFFLISGSREKRLVDALAHIKPLLHLPHD